MKAVFVNGNMEQDIKQEIAQAVMGEDALPGPEPPRRKTKLTERTAAKVTAFLLLVVMAMTLCGGILAALVFYNADVYITPEDDFKRELLEGVAYNDAYNLISWAVPDGEGRDRQERAEDFCANRNIAYAAIRDDRTGEEIWHTGNAAYDSLWNFTYTYTWYQDDMFETKGGIFYEDLEDAVGSVLGYDTARAGTQNSAAVEASYTAELVLDDAFPFEDEYELANRLADIAYALRYWIYAILAAAAVLVVVCFIFLLCAAGHRSGADGVRPGWGTRIPFDLLTAVVALGVFLGVEVVVELWLSGPPLIAALILGTGALAGVFTGWCMSLALRVKLGGWWRNTLACMALRLCWKALKMLGRGLRGFGCRLAELLWGIPLVGKTAAAFFALVFVELMGLILSLGVFWYAPEVLALLWIAEKILLFLAVLAAALMCRKLLLGGRALAAGDLSYQVDTKGMVLDFKSHGEDLNHIAQGMAAAVDQRMRSERMKTELITNVSHDIKTPLTSIINYADLIGKEPRDSEKIPEYAAVLTRQSERLKRLIEDLVEASKASTGNLEVDLAPCQPGVLLTQAAGEYEQRLKDAGLDLVTRQPETPVTILADGRRLWRVFDNLMNNICKYAQRGTRVYLTLEERDGQAVISFKNTSRAPLDIPAEELLERFVRGDAARTGEGSGLGLSIAKSLTELQRGTLELTVDGDLFKVVLRFPTVS